MKIKVVVVVYDRLYNIQHWIQCWKKCVTNNAQLIIIHNTDIEQPEYKQVVESNGHLYIQRPNIGYDIGAFQDVCRGRLNGFPEWDKMLWLTDDTYPMRYNFIDIFNNKMKPGIGVVCMKISGEVREHIRTTGFMIDKSTARNITFIVDPIVTKMDCYMFEHKSWNNTFMQQIKRMKLKVIQVSENSISPLWDSMYHKRLKREEEHYKIFGKVEPTNKLEITNYIPKKVTFICLIYNSYPAIITSLLMQSNSNWELWLVHDGPGDIQNISNDERIKIIYTPTRMSNWGHQHRSDFLQKVTTEYVVITNADNYHTPTYIEKMMNGFNNDTVGVYCSGMIHSYLNWEYQKCRLERGHIDCAGMMLNTQLAQKVGWNHVTEHSADWFFFNDLMNQYGKDKFVKIKGCLLVHN